MVGFTGSRSGLLVDKGGEERCLPEDDAAADRCQNGCDVSKQMKLLRRTSPVASSSLISSIVRPRVSYYYTYSTLFEQYDFVVVVEKIAD